MKCEIDQSALLDDIDAMLDIILSCEGEIQELKNENPDILCEIHQMIELTCNNIFLKPDVLLSSQLVAECDLVDLLPITLFSNQSSDDGDSDVSDILLGEDCSVQGFIEMPDTHR